MASSVSRKLYGGILTRYKANANPSFVYFCTKSLSEEDSDSDSDFNSGTTNLSSSNHPQFKGNTERTLENGLDLGIYKAILIGQLGQAPIPKTLKSGRIVTLLSVGTGGIRNNRRPLDNEEPKDYANRCAVQWHRVSLYPERLGELAVKNFVPGSILYVEGNLETKIFNDPITGLVRRIREIAVRRNDDHNVSSFCEVAYCQLATSFSTQNVV
ncbi:single-stranded DNA-binding protein, mitochondrial [Dorcoceras hygrometricum]|uniref:Single-stranded DNA-binding protein, mitochondrial n=1 Tax=Dorcoceras hygrometricum TaxID=472368 RepID=A0A2Z7AKQ7_9LAMI|nr:single-stranded DNA-binding protein, mitochondrial [Dorcoceras hygrometricum]